MTEGWPPRWDGPQFKQAAGSAKVKRGKKREARADREDAKKAEVRLRDRYCRFPLCGCKRFQLALREVSHSKHKGMGGNPAEDRSDPDSMVLLCDARHKANKFSVDRKTLRWKPLTKDGSDGPIAWEIDARELRSIQRTPALIFLAIAQLPPTRWFELARETQPHLYEPTSSEQSAILAWLRGMDY